MVEVWVWVYEFAVALRRMGGGVVGLEEGENGGGRGGRIVGGRREEKCSWEV